MAGQESEQPWHGMRQFAVGALPKPFRCTWLQQHGGKQCVPAKTSVSGRARKTVLLAPKLPKDNSSRDVRLAKAPFSILLRRLFAQSALHVYTYDGNSLKGGRGKRWLSAKDDVHKRWSNVGPHTIQIQWTIIVTWQAGYKKASKILQQEFYTFRVSTIATYRDNSVLLTA